MSKRITKVVIAGGGTAGWLAACGLSTRLKGLVEVTLVESEAIGTVGVGEASIPPMRNFHRLMDVDEQEFMRATQATFKLGIVFDNWGEQGQSYIHSFGQIGQESWMAEFHQFWLEAKAQGFGGSLGDYCLELQAAWAGKFAAGKEAGLNYAYHLDASRYARYLRERSERAGAKRIEGKITQVQKDPQTQEIQALELDDGRRIEGDLFIDCTGFRALLIGDALGIDYEDWSHWLASDSAVAVQTTTDEPPPPYTRAIAHPSGWQWRIPLQHRMGNGLVYSSRFLSDDQAKDLLLSNISGDRLTEPRLLKYRTGRRREAWHRNCVAFGLSSGFVEPLESTSIHLIMTAIVRLIRLFPFKGIEAESLRARFNEETRSELEAIRDFIILHYKLTQRSDSDFWNHYRTLEIPETLAHRMAIFEQSGYAWPDEVALFRVDSWVQVMFGQGLEPQAHHLAARLMEPGALRQSLERMKASIDQKVAQLPTHGDFVRRYCGAPE